MNTTIVLQARQVQAPLFSPRLQQAVRLLQMSSQDYAQALRDAAELNPFLEIDAPQQDDGAEAPPSETEGDEAAAAELEAAAAFDRTDAAPAPRDGHLSHDESFDVMQRVPLRESLRAHLHGQLGVLRLSSREMAFARALVEALDDDGYLRISLEDIGTALGETGAGAERELRTALRRVQALDPTGVAARSVAECLGLQLEASARNTNEPMDASEGTRRLARRILEEHIGLLAAHDVGKLAKALDASPQDVQSAIDCIRRLNPHPGWQFGETAARIVIPDVTVKKVRGIWKTSLNASALPRVKLNTAYAQLFEKHRASQCPAMKECLEQARWLVGGVSQRASTILAVARAIVARQKMFFEHGPLAMKPLGLREIADEVGVHPSTVSRTVHNKYMATPSGVFELQHFFSRGLDHAAGGASAPMALQGLIRELIAVEKPLAPLSDAALARQLAQQGFRIARRTVTKYRQGMNIDPFERRRAQGGEPGAPAWPA
ncbi:RNA polymerase factor sigma-54 [Variovorax sp. OV700]|uniref:RNA polymerase factor sigma-54 n=1 Tax=Variovorax sp. OV700 TaxID=1882826 RepID=UPI0008820460|nr:RNA polymerase factor sigma-54 [Variovorax sp. OV700]SDH42842.1 RNA polymerase, sigma 54 subunit, RpoN/SigL [Variovorax sp. OV700]